jgi:hypothetical protein
MAKININGEVFDYDFDHRPMSEALALEQAAGMRYAEWETELGAGSMKAMAALVWLVWRRDGRGIELKDILSGDVEVDLMPLLDSLQAAAEEAQAGPTSPGPAASGPGGTPTTGTATSPSSPASSASARGRPGSSTQPTSRR